jgi:triosephosphate isomerase
MAKPILVANWKNSPGSIDEARDLLRELGRKRGLYKKVNLFIAPPLPYLESAGRGGKSFSSLACQDMPAMPRGAYTGEITPEILKSFGVKLALAGHSERRALGETFLDTNNKVKAALRAGIVPLVCIGEKERDKDGEHFELLREEVKAVLAGLGKNSVEKIALAYEPVWAIGKSASEAIEVAELSQTVVFIRKALADLFGRAAADKVPILYGGSVEPENAGILMRGSGVRGFLVGHASLKAKSFEIIAKAITSK